MFREKKAKETFQAGLQYFPFFLEHSEPNDELVAYLQSNKLDPIRAQELPRLAWAEDKTKVEQTIESYLQVRSCISSINHHSYSDSAIEM
jgi:hypothetical protein